jgi:hypothetical protein
MPHFHVTYDIVTSDSAEHGDTAEHGFVHAMGGRDPIAIVPMGAADYAMDLRTAIRLSNPCWDCGTWFQSEPSIEDYSTDETLSYALHPPRSITPASYARLARLLGARR